MNSINHITAKRARLFSLLFLVAFTCLRADGTKPPSDGNLLNLKDPATIASIKPTQNSVITSYQQGDVTGVKIEVASGNATPGATFPCTATGLDLSAFSGVAAAVTNTSAIPLKVNLRVDNNGDWQKNPWNAEFVMIDPGSTATIHVKFGNSYNMPGYNLDSHNISGILIFVEQPSQSAAIIVKSLKAE